MEPPLPFQAPQRPYRRQAGKKVLPQTQHRFEKSRHIYIYILVVLSLILVLVALFWHCLVVVVVVVVFCRLVVHCYFTRNNDTCKTVSGQTHIDILHVTIDVHL